MAGGKVVVGLSLSLPNVQWVVKEAERRDTTRSELVDNILRQVIANTGEGR